MPTNNVKLFEAIYANGVYGMGHGENGVRQQNNNNSQFRFFLVSNCNFFFFSLFSKPNEIEKKKEQKFSVCCTFDIRKCDWRATTVNYGASGAILAVIHLRRMCNTRRNVSSSSSSTMATASHTKTIRVYIVPCVPAPLTLCSLPTSWAVLALHIGRAQ